MFFKLFKWLLKKTPFTLAVAIPNTLWAITSAVFGLFLILVKADFAATGTRGIFIYAISISIVVASLLVFLEFGFLRLIGVRKWERKEIRTVNDNIINGEIRKGISGEKLLKVYDSLGKTHGWLLQRNIQYTSAVVIICAIIELVASGQLKNVPVILIGGMIAIYISFICTIPLYELLLSSTRRKCKMLLAEKDRHFEDPSFLSLKIKSKFFIILTGLALGIILLIVPSLSLIHPIFLAITLFLTNVLSKLVFESIYRAFIEIKESAKELEQGKRTSFLTGSLDKEIIDLSKSLDAASNEIYNIKNTLEIQVKARTKALEEEKRSLEEKVKLRTKELQEQIEDLEKFHKITIGRELKMIKLKEEVERLKKQLGK